LGKVAVPLSREKDCRKTGCITFGRVTSDVVVVWRVNTELYEDLQSRAIVAGFRSDLSAFQRDARLAGKRATVQARAPSKNAVTLAITTRGFGRDVT
jgi:hypothetical protein